MNSQPHTWMLGQVNIVAQKEQKELQEEESPIKRAEAKELISTALEEQSSKQSTSTLTYDLTTGFISYLVLKTAEHALAGGQFYNNHPTVVRYAPEAITSAITVTYHMVQSYYGGLANALQIGKDYGVKLTGEATKFIGEASNKIKDFAKEKPIISTALTIDNVLLIVKLTSIVNPYILAVGSVTAVVVEAFAINWLETKQVGYCITVRNPTNSTMSVHECNKTPLEYFNTEHPWVVKAIELAIIAPAVWIAGNQAYKAGKWVISKFKGGHDGGDGGHDEGGAAEEDKQPDAPRAKEEHDGGGTGHDEDGAAAEDKQSKAPGAEGDKQLEAPGAEEEHAQRQQPQPLLQQAMLANIDRQAGAAIDPQAISNVNPDESIDAANSRTDLIGGASAPDKQDNNEEYDI